MLMKLTPMLHATYFNLITHNKTMIFFGSNIRVGHLYVHKTFKYILILSAFVFQFFTQQGCVIHTKNIFVTLQVFKRL